MSDSRISDVRWPGFLLGTGVVWPLDEVAGFVVLVNRYRGGVEA